MNCLAARFLWQDHCRLQKIKGKNQQRSYLKVGLSSELQKSFWHFNSTHPFTSIFMTKFTFFFKKMDIFIFIAEGFSVWEKDLFDYASTFHPWRHQKAYWACFCRGTLSSVIGLISKIFLMVAVDLGMQKSICPIRGLVFPSSPKKSFICKSWEKITEPRTHITQKMRQKPYAFYFFLILPATQRPSKLSTVGKIKVCFENGHL